MDKNLVIFGTRPEFIKLLPVMVEIKKQNLETQFVYVFTGQHHEMTRDLFLTFNFSPDISLEEKNHHNSLSRSYAGILAGLQEAIDDLRKTHTIKMIIGQGDTSSCACAAMSAFFNEIPFAHIEAGLRTHNMENPFPEEYFRRMISLTTAMHFVPTAVAAENLLREGITEERIVITGNTITDVIEYLKPLDSQPLDPMQDTGFPATATNVMITCHRRENQNGNFHILVETVKTLAEEYPSLNFTWISHKTPFIQHELQSDLFGNHPNVRVIPPLGLIEMYRLYETTRLIITDSGGVQEEAPGFNIPVIVIRDVTERSESVDLGYSVLTGMNREKILDAFRHFMGRKRTTMINPYGDAHAAKKIVDCLNRLV